MRTSLRIGAAGLLGLGLAAIGAVPAMALVGTNQPTTINAQPGATVVLAMTTGSDPSQTFINPDAGSIVFQAPAGLTFPAQSTVPTLVLNASPPSQTTTSGCVVSNAGQTLSCSSVTYANSILWDARQFSMQFQPQLTVSPTAALGTPLAVSATWTTSATNAGAPPFTPQTAVMQSTIVPTQNTQFTVSQPNVPSLAPGQTGDLELAITNNGPDATNQITTFSNFTFTLPPNVTFADNQIAQAYPNNSSGGGPCVLSNGNRTFTCNGQQSLRNVPWPVGGVQTLKFRVTVDPSAPQNVTLTGGIATLTPNSANFSTTTPVTVDPVRVLTVPLIAIPVALGALALVGGVVVAKRRRATTPA